MTVSIVHLNDVTPQRWRNGGGVTRELVAWPDAPNWLMRLSVADIERDGPFSAFPGIKRWFAVLHGSGVRLGAETSVLGVGDTPFQFDGALAPDCALIDGPTRDLNLMIQRDRATGWMHRVMTDFNWPREADCRPDVSEVRGVFSMAGCVLDCLGETRIDVPAMSVAWDRNAPVDARWCVTNQAPDALTFAFSCRPRISGEKLDG